MTKEETIQVLQSIEDRAIDFPNMTECDWVAIAAAKRHLTEEPVSEELEDFALQYAGHHAPYDDCMQEVEDAVKAGAQWQRQKDTKELQDHNII